MDQPVNPPQGQLYYEEKEGVRTYYVYIRTEWVPCLETECQLMSS